MRKLQDCSCQKYMFSFPQRIFTRKTFVIFDAFILMNYNMKFNIKPSQLNSKKVLSINTYLERETASLGKGPNEDRNKV